MKKQAIALSLLILLVFLAGCGTKTTGGVTKDVCDDLCKQERDDYIKGVNDLLAQAQVIIAKTIEWKSVTKKDLADITSLKDQVSVLKVPQDFELVHDYYSRAFGHYIEAVDYVVTANEKYASSSNTLNLELRNEMLTSVLNKVQEARKIMVYADEEVKFANNVIPKA